MAADTLELATALQLLNLPRTLGQHPESGAPVQAGVGRFGPFVVCNGVYANLKAGDDVLQIDLARALTLLAEKANGGGRSAGRTAAKSVLRELGEHPAGGPVQVLDGRYGPYVTHGKVNVTLPKTVKPEAVTLEQAVVWLAEKAEKQPAATRKTSRKGRASAAGVTTAKPAAKKAPAKPAAKVASKATTKAGAKAGGKKATAKSGAKAVGKSAPPATSKAPAKGKGSNL